MTAGRGLDLADRWTTLGRWGTALLAALVGLAIAAGSAHAAKSVDRFVGGAPGVALGQFFGAADVAVNESTGAIYVADEGNDRIVRLAPNGAAQRAWGADVVAGNTTTGFEICTSVQQCKAGVEGHGSGELINPSGVAVDQADGSVYVWDTRSGTSAADTNARVQKFDADGNFILMFGKGVNATTGGDVCTAASGNVCQAGLAGTAVGQFSNPSVNRPTLAVSPVDGDVFVADPGSSTTTGRRVQRFNPDGTFQAVIGSSTNFASGHPRAVAVDSRGVVYIADGNSGGQIDRYDSAGVHGAAGFLTSIGAPPLLVGSATANLGLKVYPDPEADGPAGSDTDRLYVLRDPTSGPTVVQQFDSPGEVAVPSLTDTHGAAAGFAAARGLGLSSARGELLVSGTFGVGQGFFILDDDGTGPIAAMDASATNVTPTTADLIGTIDPGDGVVRYHFEYSADGTTYLSTLAAMLEGTDPEPVAVPVTGLDSNALYRVKLVVSKVIGPETTITEMSADQVFVTAAAPPAATTLGPADRTDRSAQLRGRVDPNGSATTYRFEYGLAGGSFDGQVPVPDGSAGSGNVALDVAAVTSNLIPDTAYQYRLVASNSAGSSAGALVTFRTQPTAVAQPPLGGRGYELVSPADKLGGTGVGEWYRGPGSIAGGAGIAAFNSERVAAQGTYGSTLLDGEHNYANDWAFADRVDSTVGWRSHSPYTHPNAARSLASFLNMNASSDDLSSLYFTSNNTPAVFPELGLPGWGQFDAGVMSDWDGGGTGTRWELFGPSALSQVAPPTQLGGLWALEMSGDGNLAVGETQLHPAAGVARVVGLAGPGDPTNPTSPTPDPPAGELDAGRSIYAADLSGGLADSFAGTGPRELVNVCSGTTGPARTRLPAVDGAGDLLAEECAPVTAGRSGRLVSNRGAAFPGGDGFVSSNGARIFFLAPDPLATGVPNGTLSFCDTVGETCPPQLFVRQRNTNGTVTVRWLSQAVTGLLGTQDATLTGSVRFEGATPDGDKVLFRTNSPLTVDDPNGTGGPAPAGGVKTGTASGSSWDLYLYDLPDGPDGDPATADTDPAGGQLTRISAGPSGSGDCNSPVPTLTTGADAGRDTGDVGALRFVSEDGRRVYFACAAPLPDVPAPTDGTVTTPGGSSASSEAVNFYLFDAGQPVAAQRWRFIARLPRTAGSPLALCASAGTAPGSAFTSIAQAGEIVASSTRANCVRGTADGAFLMFSTDARLTTDDPMATPTGDIYGYDAERDELTRISAPQGGVGGAYECAQDNPRTTGTVEPALLCYADAGASGVRAANQPLGVATDPVVVGDRVAFFHSASRLVLEDTDSSYDVYQWRNGELSLLTPGESGSDDALYLGNDRGGRNVYFATRDSLTWQDFDVVADVYSARIGGGVEQPGEPVVCGVLAGGCHGGDASPVPTAPVTSAPGGGDADEGPRPELAVKVTKRAVRRAALTGTLAVGVRTNSAGTIRAVARARLRGPRKVLLPLRRVGSDSSSVSGAGSTTLDLRLNRAARRQLRRGQAVRLQVSVSGAAARARTVTVLLRRPAR